EIVRTLKPEKRDYEIQRIDGLPDKYVTPRSPETIERIKREVKLKAAARPTDTQATWYAGEFVWPAKGRISGVYGSQRILNGKPKRPHYGVDVAAPAGTPVVAPAPGIVRLAEKDMYFEGGLIFLDHGHGVISVLMHLSDVFVKAGDEVKQGQKVAAIGSTGRSTGAHLDWRMYWREAHVDPTLMVGPMETKEDPAKATGGAE
ncbi:MAG: M23 family metallopeptidase, partial [Alphaproteobacteria bacterium]